MFALDLAHGRTPLRHVLCLGAHSDDIEIGCGGTLLTLLAARPDLAVTWVVFSGAGTRRAEAEASAAKFLAGAHHADVRVHDFRDGFFPHQGVAIKEAFEALKTSLAPDVVFTHHGADLHQDHRVLSELAWNTFRDHLVLEYEIPKYDGGLGSPNVFVPLADAACQRKTDLLLECFPTQAAKRWFTPELFRALMRLRGMECNAPSGYAEAFHARKVVLG